MTQVSGLARSFVLNEKQVDQFGYRIGFVKRTNNSSADFGFTTYVRQFQIYESIQSGFMYVEGVILDGGAVAQKFGIQAGDKLVIDLYKDPTDSEELILTKEFFIERLGGENRTDNNKGVNYTFRAVSQIGMESLKSIVKKTYTGKGSDIVKSICEDYLLIPPGTIQSNNFTESYSELVFTVPSLPPLEAINSIKNYCAAADNNDDVNYFFYERRDGIFFKPLGKIVESANAFSYVVPVDKNRDPSGVANDYFRVLDYSHYHVNDHRENINNGGLENKTLSFNFIDRTIEQSTFNLKQDKDKIKLLGEHLLLDDEEIDNYANNEIRFTDESHCLSIRCSDNSYDRPIDTLQLRMNLSKAQMSLLNQTIVSITVHGNPRIKPGDIIKLTVAQPAADETEERDIFLNGNYLVLSCKHVVAEAETYNTVCDLYKDSYETDISSYRKDTNSHFIKPRVSS